MEQGRLTSPLFFSVEKPIPKINLPPIIILFEIGVKLSALPQPAVMTEERRKTLRGAKALGRIMTSPPEAEVKGEDDKAFSQLTSSLSH
jgi:hypothetical protein